MLRRLLTIGAVFVTGFIAALGYSHLTRSDSNQRVVDPSPIVAPAVQAAAEAPPVQLPQPVSPVAEAQPEPVADPAAAESAAASRMDQLLADARSDDAKKRAAAITEMANGPRQQAVPALQSLLISAEPQVDLPLALRSLRTLAEREGDSDGRIRDAVRTAIYHSGDEASTQAAQETLGEIEDAASAAPKSSVRTRG